MPASASSSEETPQRANERFPVDIPVEYKSPVGDIVSAKVLNVSCGGMFVQTSKPLRHGQRAFFRVQLKPNALQFHLEGEVAWSKKKTGMGIRFLLNPNLAQQVISGMLLNAPPSVPA